MSESQLQSRLQAHIAQVQSDASTTLDERLFKEAETFLAVQLYNSPPELLSLIALLSSLIPILQQDPTPLVKLLGKLVEPFSFADILQLDPPVDFLSGLDVSAIPFNPLVLQLLAKASRSSKDAAMLANMPAMVQALVRLLLCTSEVGIADQAATVLVDLLRTDREESPVANHGVGDESVARAGGQGLFWRRLFGDRDVYGLLYSVCDLNTTTESPRLGKREKTLAQARLLSLLPRIGQLDWHYLVKRHNQDIEMMHGLSDGEGLLDFACLHMVNTKDDVLLHMNFLHFLAELISSIKERSVIDRNISVSLSYLLDRELHTQATSFWLNPDDPSHDPIDLKFLYGPSAHYMSTYASIYPHAFLQSQDFHPTLNRLKQAFSSISANQWAHGQSPKHDLNVLTSLPRLALLPQRSQGTSGRKSSPITLIPCKPTSPDALSALALILHGPASKAEEMTYGANGFQVSDNDSQQNTTEAAAAYALYLTYTHYHDTFISDLLTHADTVVLPEQALAAMNLLAALASANYAPLPADESSATFLSASSANTTTLPSHFLPASPTSQPSSSSTTTPKVPTPTHLAQTLSLPSASHLPSYTSSPLLLSSLSTRFLPWLLRPPQTFSHLVGGRGDPESSAYRVASAKWDLLLVIRGMIERIIAEGGEDVERVGGIKEVIDKRVMEGMWGAATGEGEVGGRIAIMEM